MRIEPEVTDTMEASKLDIATQSALRVSITEQGSAAAAAQFSLSTITLLEIISIVGSVMLINWGIVPIYPQSRWPLIFPVFLVLAFVVHSQYNRRESWSELGFCSKHFGSALRLLLFPVTLGCLFLSMVGYAANSIHLSTHFWSNLLIVPIWGLVQQYVLQTFLYRRVRFLFFHASSNCTAPRHQLWLAILVTAILFAIVHLPNILLTTLTLVAAIIWTWVYERAPNLWALGIAHGVLSLVLMHSLPLQVLYSMSVGYKHFLYQKF